LSFGNTFSFRLCIASIFSARSTASVLSSKLDGPLQAGMRPRRLHVEDAPDLVNFAFLIGRPSLGRDSHRDELHRDRSADASLQSEVDRSYVAHGRLAFQRVEVLGFRSLTLTEHEERPSGRTDRYPPPERLASSGVLLGHQAPGAKPSARRSTN
jgi:hypothetical protein